MGRDRKLGDQQCPKIDCIGYGELGRYRQHSRLKSKNMANVRFAKHYTFIHNNRGIPEHYAAYSNRQFWHRDTIVDKIEEETYKSSHYFYKIVERVKTLPLTEEDKRRWVIACIKHQENVIIPKKHILVTLQMEELSRLTGEPLPEDIQHAYNGFVEGMRDLKEKSRARKEVVDKWPRNKVIREAEKVLMKDPYLSVWRYIYEKYDRPERLKRNRRRNKKVSDWPVTTLAEWRKNGTSLSSAQLQQS